MTYTGMFLSLLILAYNGFRGINRYLSAFLFLSSFYIYLQLIIAYSTNEWLLAILGIGFSSVYYLIGPLGYFYMRAMLRDDSALSKKDYVHFLVFVVVVLGAMPFIVFTSMEEKREVARILISDNWIDLARFRPNKLLSTRGNEILKAVQGTCYVILLWALLYRNRHKLVRKKQAGGHQRLLRNWLYLFAGLYMLMVFMRIVYSWMLTQSPSKSDFLALTRHFHFIGAVGFFGMNIGLIIFPSILYGLPIGPRWMGRRVGPMDAAELEEKEIQEEDILEEDEYSQFFSREYITEIEERLHQWVLEEKYLEPDITLARLAFSMHIPQHHLSYYFNFVSEKKFTDWRNYQRIDYACRLMREGKSKTLTIEAIAHTCGFRSKATFYRLFKQTLQQTPSEYLESLETDS